MRYGFRWNEWNVNHVAEHGVTPEEAEYIINRATRPFPRKQASGKYLVRGQTESGRWVQAIYVVDPEPLAYVIHARPLDDLEKRMVRRSRR